MASARICPRCPPKRKVINGTRMAAPLAYLLRACEFGSWHRIQLVHLQQHCQVTSADEAEICPVRYDIFRM